MGYRVAYNKKNEREVVTFISQMKVDTEDDSLYKPNKFIGRTYNQKDAEGFINLNSLRLRIAAKKGRQQK